VFEFGELAVEIKSGDEFEHACGHEHHQAGDGVEAEGMCRIGFHDQRNSVVKEGNGEKDTDRPTQPGIDVAEPI